METPHETPITINSSQVIKQFGKGWVMFVCAKAVGAAAISLFGSPDYSGPVLGYAETSPLAPNIVNSYGIRVFYERGLSAQITGEGSSEFTIFTWPTTAGPDRD